ncbi:hydrolase [Aquibacillus rhizosphaerae]|uniref:Hydrolase n=1 Tax=Aquibacillus rhizosphaerae TaxID=3051431 RepID=A0ABT7L9M4_9BACI|nr:hydrolase [Aquibacillus sp. LR5S19]MDL4842566.1 hydrolase [Aquibacillus sp. LR5S19]
MEKKKYFVNLATQAITQVQEDDINPYTIYATGEEIFHLREILTEMHDSDMNSFWRAHVPYVPYHNDKSNDSYDEGIVSAFQMIHDLGDDKTKMHIESMGILDSN